MKIYLSGKIAGDDGYRAKFALAEHALKQRGHVVLNPAVLPDGLSSADYMRISLAMLDSADAVATLRDWNHSAGAKVEVGYAARIGRECHPLRHYTTGEAGT